MTILDQDLSLEDNLLKNIWDLIKDNSCKKYLFFKINLKIVIIEFPLITVNAK